MRDYSWEWEANPWTYIANLTFFLASLHYCSCLLRQIWLINTSRCSYHLQSCPTTKNEGFLPSRTPTWLQVEAGAPGEPASWCRSYHVRDPGKGRNPAPGAREVSFGRQGMLGLGEQLGHVTSTTCAGIVSNTNGDNHSPTSALHKVFIHIMWQECPVTSFRSALSFTYLWSQSQFKSYHVV